MPTNAGYYHAAYLAAAAIYLVYAGTLLWRARRVHARVVAQRRTV